MERVQIYNTPIRTNQKGPKSAYRISVALVQFSDQKWNSQNSLFNLHINCSMHIIKAASLSFERVAIALVHSCNWLCTFVCGFLHHQLLLLCCWKCVIFLYAIALPLKTSSHYGKDKMVDLVIINCQAYFLLISIRLFINLPGIV